MSVSETPIHRTGPERPSAGERIRRWFKRLVAKTLIFVVFTLVVLNPNLKRAFLQVDHVMRPESLIQPDFAAMPLINRMVDQFIAADQGKHTEARLVARFVVKNIRYVRDYENWGNLDYWPTAEETWQKRQEDCDGRAVLAVSILRSRGFPSASLAAGLDHMWITVDENEKDPSKPVHYVALLSPNPDFSFKIRERSRWSDLVGIAKAFLHPTAFRGTSTHLLADIPAVRKFILITGLLCLCAYRCQSARGLLGVLGLGLAAAAFLARWQPDKGPLFPVVCGNVLLLMAMVGAFAVDRLAAMQKALMKSC